MARRPLLLALCGLLVAGALHAVAAPKEDKALRGSLADKAFSTGRATLAPDTESIDSIRPFAKAAGGRFDAFAQARGGAWTADVDKRTGNVAYVEGAGIALVPGRGNNLTTGDVKALGGRVDLAGMERVAREFLPGVAQMMG